MKRIAGAPALLLLTGLCGCISITPTGPEVKKSAGEMKQPSPTAASTTGPAATAVTENPVPLPASSRWTGPSATQPQTNLVDHTAARPTTSASPYQPEGNVVQAPVPPLQRPNQPRPEQTPPLPQPPAPFPEMPSARTPPNDPAVQPANHVQPEVAPPTPRPVPMPPAPSVKNSRPAESRQAAASGKGGAPLFRLVNTRRITLNFAVQDVGASGVSAVELWFTQDGKEWRKLDAPPQAKAYVVEVDDEGTYGFTLIAKSGMGLAKEPPHSGDSPQVWVIVDLTRPDVQLTEATPSVQAGQQIVTIKWRASDKNMGRQPITLSYAEKEEGPWKVIAAGLDNVGSYNWEVPKGTPAKMLFRVEASDLAGNVGRATPSKPVLMDNSVPTVQILKVDANSSR
jgi:hypothetical protein